MDPKPPAIFVTVQKGDYYHDPHLIGIVDRTDDHNYEIESIPLMLVKKIEKMQSVSDHVDPMVQGRGDPSNPC